MFAHQKRYEEIRLEIFLGYGDYERELTTINDYFYELIKPKDYSNAETHNTNSFDRVVAVLEDNGAPGARFLSVREFFNRAKYCENKFKVK